MSEETEVIGDGGGGGDEYVFSVRLIFPTAEECNQNMIRLIVAPPVVFALGIGNRSWESRGWVRYAHKSLSCGRFSLPIALIEQSLKAYMINSFACAYEHKTFPIVLIYSHKAFDKEFNAAWEGLDTSAPSTATTTTMTSPTTPTPTPTGEYLKRTVIIARAQSEEECKFLIEKLAEFKLRAEQVPDPSPTLLSSNEPPPLRPKEPEDEAPPVEVLSAPHRYGERERGCSVTKVISPPPHY